MTSASRCIALCVLVVAFRAHAQPSAEDNIAGPYVPTPSPIVEDMLRLADVRSGDVLYDLGSGDGRLVIEAAKRYGARGVGVELQADLVKTANAGAKRDGVADRAKFVQGDLFETDLRDATVVTLYLLPRFATRLVPKLRAELRPGARVVSHDYPLSPWPADKVLTLDLEEKEAISGTTRTNIYYYVVPARVAGVWQLTLPKALAAQPLALHLQQEPDALEGFVLSGDEKLPLRDLAVRAERIRFGLILGPRFLEMRGTVSGQTMSGEFRVGNARDVWSARYRAPR
jgi:ubiquinone/menaquinone biosynthesis C-methylase UbiE